MKLYIVRHGATELNGTDIFRGRRDIPLSDKGKKESAQIAEYFSGKTIKRIIASPLTRAQETAAVISEATGAPIDTRDEFIDMHFSGWEGLTVDEVQKRFPVQLEAWTKWPQKFRIRGGENLTNVRRRVVQGLQRIEEEDGGDIVVVTHRVICKLIVLHFLSMPNQLFWKIQCDSGSVTVIERRENDITLVVLNETCHLRA